MLTDERFKELEERLAVVLKARPYEVRQLLALNVKPVEKVTNIEAVRGTHSINYRWKAGANDTPPPGYEMPPRPDTL